MLESSTIIVLSLWKTYVGPALAVGFAMGYIEAVGYTLLGAAITVCATLYFEGVMTQLFNRLRSALASTNQQQQPTFKPSLRRALRFYRRYGFWGLMLLTPVLVGLPVGIWIAVRLGSAKLKVAITVMIMALFWSSLSYYLTFKGLAQWVG
jgi:uncharacterized membrane protein